MPCKNWDEEWLKNHSKKTIIETLDLYNKVHGTSKTYDALKYKLSDLEIQLTDDFVDVPFAVQNTQNGDCFG